MMWKNKYWNVISRTKILIPNDMIKKSYITYKFYNFLLYIILNLIVIWTLTGISDNLSLLKGTYGVGHLLIGYFFAIWTLEFPITRILGLTLFGLTFINTILCHRNFGKNFTFYVESMKFNPNLDKEFEYSNDLDDDDDDDDEEEEEEKDEKILERLKRYWKFIKKTFYDVFIPLIEE
ncbi:unnamed protein product [Rhizophagus irregularis]|nr:unnamed protein product [Rhizophagus irregularis]